METLHGLNQLVVLLVLNHALENVAHLYKDDVSLMEMAGAMLTILTVGKVSMHISLMICSLLIHS